MFVFCFSLACFFKTYQLTIHLTFFIVKSERELWCRPAGKFGRNMRSCCWARFVMKQNLPCWVTWPTWFKGQSDSDSAADICSTISLLLSSSWLTFAALLPFLWIGQTIPQPSGEQQRLEKAIPKLNYPSLSQQDAYFHLLCSPDSPLALPRSQSSTKHFKTTLQKESISQWGFLDVG